MTPEAATFAVGAGFCAAGSSAAAASGDASQHTRRRPRHVIAEYDTLEAPELRAVSEKIVFDQSRRVFFLKKKEAKRLLLSRSSTRRGHVFTWEVRHQK
jgi:hypothetical protein